MSLELRILGFQRLGALLPCGQLLLERLLCLRGLSRLVMASSRCSKCRRQLNLPLLQSLLSLQL